MAQHWRAKVRSAALVASIFCLEGAGAFLAPASFASSDTAKLQERRCRGSPFGCTLGRTAVAPRMAADEDDGDSVVVASNSKEAAAKAAKLRAFAAELRSQADDLEAQRDSEKRQEAQRAFDKFDTNDDGMVDVKELIAGLEGQLRQDFIKRMTKTMKRKPSQAEVDEKISEMPGGALLPVELGQKLIEIYDTNGDGVLQPSEFAPKADLRVRLESLFADRAQEARLEAAAAREREIEDRGVAKAKEEAKARGLALPEDFNDGPPTVADRLLSALPYALPLMDNLAFGAHIFQTFPTQLNFLEPLVAILLIYRSLPFSGLILFFGLQWFAGKPEVNKLVRYNLRQAVYIDIAMFFPSIFAFLVSAVLGDDASKLAPVATVGGDIVFVTVVLCVLYSIGSSALGVVPDKLPVISAMNREGTRGGDGDGDDRKSGGSDGDKQP